MKRKKSTHEMSIPVSALIGMGICILLTVLMSMLGAMLVDSERLDIEAMKWLSVVIYIVSAFLGTWTALSIGKQKLAIITGITIGGTVLVLICAGMLFWGSTLGSVLTGILSIAAGGLVACMIKLKIGSVHKKKRKPVFR